MTEYITPILCYIVAGLVMNLYIIMRVNNAHYPLRSLGRGILFVLLTTVLWPIVIFEIPILGNISMILLDMTVRHGMITS